MNKQALKRHLAGWTAAVLTVAGMGSISAFAEVAAPYERNYSFDTASIGDPANVTDDEVKAIFGSDWGSLSFDQKTEDGKRASYRYSIEDKVLGKSAGDKAFRLYVDSSVTEKTGTDPMQKIILNDTNETKMTVKKGEYLEVSFDMAFSGELGEKTVSAQYAGIDGRRLAIFTVGANGTVNFLNERVKNAAATKDIQLDRNSWYNIRMVFRAGDDAAAESEKNICWLYIDNQLVTEKTFVPTHDNGKTTPCFTGFQFFWFSQQAFDDKKGLLSTDRQLSERNLYLDNIRIASSAAQPAEKTWSKKMDFNSLTPTDQIEEAANILAENPGVWNIAGTRHRIKASDTYGADKAEGSAVAIKGGIYGKPADDLAVDLYNLEGNTGDATRFYRLGDVTETWGGGSYSSNNQPLCNQVEDGDYYEIEFYSAWEENTFKQLQGYYAGELERTEQSTQWGSATGKADVMSIDQNGAIRAFGNTVQGVSLAANKWYKFNLIVHNSPDGENKVPFTLYVDNQRVLDASFLPQVDNAPTRGSLKGNVFSGFSALNLNNITNVAKTEEYKNAEHHVYFDDIKVTNYKATMPVYSAPKLITGNAALDHYLNGSLSGYTDSSVIYDSQNWKVDGNPAVLYQADGNAVPSGTKLTAPLYYFMAKDANGAALYGMLQNASSVLKDVTFTKDTKITDHFGYGEKPYTVLSYENDGFGGKPTGETYLKLTTTNAMSLTDPFLQIASAQAKEWDKNKPYHVEFSICLTEGFDQVNFQIIGVNDKEKERMNVISFHENHNVYDHKGNVIGGYRMGEWNRVSVSCYPASNQVEVRLNGKLISSQQLFSDASNRTSRIKLEQSFFSAKETAPMSASLMLDRFMMTQGSRQNADSSGITLSSASSDLQIYDAGRVIFMKNENMDMMEFAQSVNGMGSATIRKIYTDDTLTAESTELANGNVFLVSDGTYYNYYKLVHGEAAKVILRSLDGLEKTPGTYDIAAKTEFYHPFAGGTLVLAQYDKNGVLISCATAPVSASAQFPGGELLDHDALSYPVSAQDTEISFTVKEAEGSVIKAFLLDDQNVPFIFKKQI